MSIVNICKRIMVFLVTGSVSVILAACYGTPIEEMYYKIIRTKSKDGKPIEGLQLKLSNNSGYYDSQKSNSNGETRFDITFRQGADSLKVLIEDVDGEANGGIFKKQEIKLGDNDLYEVTMEKMK